MGDHGRVDPGTQERPLQVWLCVDRKILLVADQRARTTQTTGPMYFAIKVRKVVS